jgi:hypothetical protein
VETLKDDMEIASAYRSQSGGAATVNRVRFSIRSQLKRHMQRAIDTHHLYRTAAYALALALTGCAGEMPRHSQTTTPSPATPPVIQVEQNPYLRSLYADPRLDPIRDKVPLLLKPDSIKPSYLANEQRPTPEEKKAIVAWLQVRDRAQQYLTSQRGEPSQLLVQTRNQVTRAIAQLHRGELTYGGFARRIRQIDEDYQTAARLANGQHN